MGAKFYFFTDPDLLAPQTAQQAYGPVAAVDAPAGKDQFRVTDLHSRKSGSTDAMPAFAICNGNLCAQWDVAGTLTLILKPSQAPPFESPVVSYFIYRGIDPQSLLNSAGDQVLDETDSKANDLTKAVAKEWKKQNNTTSLAGSCDALGLDRDSAFLFNEGGNQIHIFTDNDPLERLFTFPHSDYQVPPVKAGDVIGSFKGNACGFEIVLQRLGYKPKLELARSADNVISVNSLSATNGGAPWQADDYDYFAHWHEKEQVLAYLDPCAYFGSFVQARLNKKSVAGTASKVGNLYQEVLQNFANKNVAWLDIRNNYGYSYNLFGLYDNTVKFIAYKAAANTKTWDFRKGSWPILKLPIADVPGTKKPLVALHRTTLCLPVGLSMAPAVLVSKGFVKRLGHDKAKFKAPAISLANSGDTYYSPIRLSFPLTTENSQDVFVCSYTRINLYERTHEDPQASTPLSIASREYLSGLFRLHDLRLDRDFVGNALRFDLYAEEVLVDMSLNYGHVYAGGVGVAEDATQVTLFTLPMTFLHDELNAGRPCMVASLVDKFANGSGSFQDWLTRQFPSAKITRATINKGSSSEIDAVIARNPKNQADAVLSGLGRVTDYCFVILAKSDHASLVNAIEVTGDFGMGWPLFSTVSSITNKIDLLSNVPYLERTLVATNYQPDGGQAKVVKCDLTWSISAVEYADY